MCAVVLLVYSLLTFDVLVWFCLSTIVLFLVWFDACDFGFDFCVCVVL